MTLGDLQICEQVFQQALRITGQPSYDDPIIRGIFGLASPLSNSSTPGFVSPVANAVLQGNLKSNLFALKLSEPGELMMGDVNRELFCGEISWFPLSNTSTKVLPEAWQMLTRLG
jgi:hypothetical protein